MQVDTVGKVAGTTWGPVMDEAWAGFQRTPPTHLKVQIQDGPGDEKTRK